MRSVLMLSFALLPTAVLAQARTITSVAPETTMTAAISGAPAAIAASPARHVKVHETIRAYVNSDALLSDAATESFTFGAPNYQTAPKLTAWSNIPLSEADLATVPVETSVRVGLLVDRQGLPENIHIEHSAGKALDDSVLSAVKQFRFQPATEEHLPVEKAMTVSITIKK